MSILYNPNAFYEPDTGVLYLVRNNELQPQSIQYSDSEASMATKQFPTTVKPVYVSMIKQQTLKILSSFYGLGSKVDLVLSLVSGQPQAGPFLLTVKIPSGPDVELYVSQLADAINQDPVNGVALKRFIMNALTNAGYQLP
jgi:hypothetical protein